MRRATKCALVLSCGLKYNGNVSPSSLCSIQPPRLCGLGNRCGACLFILLVVFSSSLSQASTPVPSITLGQNFAGSIFGTDTAATPPDANGAIGPRHFVEFINGSFAVYN